MFFFFDSIQNYFFVCLGTDTLFLMFYYGKFEINASRKNNIMNPICLLPTFNNDQLIQTETSNSTHFLLQYRRKPIPDIAFQPQIFHYVSLTDKGYL